MEEMQQSAEQERDSLRRALRDLEAAEARVQRNAARVYDETREKLVGELLPVLDNLDRTIRAAEDQSDPSLVEGVRMVRSQLEAVLARYGVTRIEATGQPFDPAIHDAVFTVAVTDPRYDRLVIDQVEPGYRFADRVLRPAKVTVGIARR
jgi:molecular chaperone GrpE